MDQLLRAIRLRQEVAAHRYVLLFAENAPRSQDKVDGWPTAPNDDRQAQSIHTSRHVYVGKYDQDPQIGFEMHDGLVRRCSVQSIEAGTLKGGGRAYSEDRLIFDHEN